ncbi:MAG TPA: hypothetical protein VN625_09970 [Desulfuromonadaceae bacterium]|nr:hypothetical protein [Desulfuromonadaceae bacterium]
MESIFQWPDLPSLPPVKQPVLVRLVTSGPRSAARQELRLALRQVLAAWSGLAPERLPLLETSRGPQWQGLLADESLDISLSYCDGEGWIGLIRGAVLGIDAMLVQPFAEAESVARHYLGKPVMERICASRDPAKAFASAWTGLEARLKCLKRELTEGEERQSGFEKLAASEIFFKNGVAVTVAMPKETETI